MKEKSYVVQVCTPCGQQFVDYESTPNYRTITPDYGEAMAKKQDLEAKFGAQGFKYRVVERITECVTTDREVDDGVRYGVQFYCGADGYLMESDKPDGYRTEAEARRVLAYTNNTCKNCLARIVKITPL